ncbi:MAG TPA: ABC transporter permease [Luteitalea sp.]|nr:ABC transporter permease [Luteitalea sp.]
MTTIARILRRESTGLVVVLAALILVFGLSTGHFVSRVTLLTIANQVPALTMAAVGMTLVIITGGIDLSVGSVMACAAAVLAVALTEWQWPLPVALAAATACGMLSGLFNGLVAVRFSVPSFIVTLGTLEIARGLAYLVTDSRSVFVGARLDAIGAPWPWLGVSTAVLVALTTVLLAQMLLTRTVFGRYVVAIGTNREAVRLAGIDPRPVEIAVFALAGILAGVAGVFHVAYLESADPNAGLGLELSAIAAVVIGGSSLMGGRGSVVGSFLGVLIIAVLQAGLAQAGASEPLKRVVTGAVIVAAVVVDGWRRRRRAVA